MAATVLQRTKAEVSRKRYSYRFALFSQCLVSFPSYCAMLQHPLPLPRPATPGNSRCQSLQGCGFHCLPGAKAGLKSTGLIPAVSEGCVRAVHRLFAEPVGFGWPGQGSRSGRCWHSALRFSPGVGRLPPVCVALPRTSAQTLGAVDILQHDRDGRREALATLAWFQAKEPCWWQIQHRWLVAKISISWHARVM